MAQEPISKSQPEAKNLHKPGAVTGSGHWLGVDTGGTFTDFVYFNGESVQIHKVLSTPRAPEQAILQGIDEMQIPCDGLHLIHGSTVATNAVLEAKGVKTAYVTNKGFADVLSIGRQARHELYNLRPLPRPALIPREQCLEVDTRLSAKGELLKPLQQADIKALIERLQQMAPRAVAINFLFSFVDSEQEQQLKQRLQQALPAETFICCSSDVLPEYKEYERGMATVLNAYVGPLMSGYLSRLVAGVNARTQSAAAHVAVLQSSAGTISAADAASHAVRLLLSGPAGGLKAAQYVAGLSGHQRLLSFDMGGTSTDVALMDGGIGLSSEAQIADYPVAVPMVDMHTIGAGGGSIAYIDEGGLLNVGPESAGASPGPACYGQGGTRPTVTDANLVLGRLRADGFLGQGMSLDITAARAALKPLAEALQLSIEATAQGIVRIANEHMVRALRTISVQRGYDPQDFVLTCFGGAGGLHVCALADALQMQQAIVPVYAGVLSALGMLVAEPSRELSHSCIQVLKESDVQQLEADFRRLEQLGMAEIAHEVSGSPELRRYVDLRYRGQSFTLRLDLPAGDSQGLDAQLLARLEAGFHQQHEQTYGHRLEVPVELVNLRLSVKGAAPPFALPVLFNGNAYGRGVDAGVGRIAEAPCYGYATPLVVYQRDRLQAGQCIQGPALILEKVSTTLIDSLWQAEPDQWGNLHLRRNGSPA